MKWHIDVLDCSVPLADATPDPTALHPEQGGWLHVRAGAQTDASGHACDFLRLATDRELACTRCNGLDVASVMYCDGELLL